MKKKILGLALLTLLVLGLSATLVLACDPPPPPGVGTPGFWKNHPDAWPQPVNMPPGEIVIWWSNPYVSYEKYQAIDIMNMPEKGDKTYTMFRAMMAARLNQLAGNDTSCIVDPKRGWTVLTVIGQARYWVAIHPPGSGVKGNDDPWQDHGEWKYEILDAYNNGELCAPSRDDFE